MQSKDSVWHQNRKENCWFPRCTLAQGSKNNAEHIPEIVEKSITNSKLHCDHIVFPATQQWGPVWLARSTIDDITGVLSDNGDA